MRSSLPDPNEVPVEGAAPLEQAPARTLSRRPGGSSSSSTSSGRSSSSPIDGNRLDLRPPSAATAVPAAAERATGGGAWTSFTDHQKRSSYAQQSRVVGACPSPWLHPATLSQCVRRATTSSQFTCPTRDRRTRLLAGDGRRGLKNPAAVYVLFYPAARRQRFIAKKLPGRVIIAGRNRVSRRCSEHRI